MNPHFQSNNTTSSPQTNPTSLQTSAHGPQQAQSGPNRYPDLPLIPNPQSNELHTQSHPYTDRAPGYIPPNQYGDTQGGLFQAENNEQAELQGQLAKMEKEYKTGSLKCYEGWNAVVLVPGFCMALIFLIAAVVTSDESNRLGYGILGATGLWIAVQSFFAISSDKIENIWMANVACWMMSISLGLSLVFEGYGIWCLCDDLTYSVYIFLGVTANLLMHIFVNMKTVFKVRKYLIAREKIEKMLKGNAINNNL